jgi:predicted NBD/HSP70 family sugar kinase
MLDIMDDKTKALIKLLDNMKIEALVLRDLADDEIARRIVENVANYISKSIHDIKNLN